MNYKNGSCPLGFLTLFLIFWINFSYGIPHHKSSLDKGHRTTDLLYSLQLSSAIPAGTTMVPPANNDNNKENTAQLPMFPIRKKRDTTGKASAGLNELQYLFSPSVDLQKYLVLLQSKPKTTYVDVDDYEDDYEPAIDLALGKKPGNMRSSGGDSNDIQGNTWASEEPTSAISLNKHRVSKKSHFTPELFLRDAAISSRTQPDPLYMRKLLARISSSRRPPRSRAEADANTNRLFALGQLLEHSSRINDGPVVHRLVL